MGFPQNAINRYRHQERQTNSFEVAAREWFAKYSPNGSANHGDRIIRRLERDIFPWIGGHTHCQHHRPQLLYEGETFPEAISAIDDYHAKAMWAFLHKPEYWKGASALLHAA